MAVHIRDDGVFDAPIEKLWKYLNDAPSHQHGAFRVTKVLEQKGNVLTIMADIEGPKGFANEKMVMTMNPPKGFDLEYLTGGMKGTKFAHTYTPQGEKTRVVVEGDFVNPPGVSDANVRRAQLAYFEKVFREDNAALKKYK